MAGANQRARPPDAVHADTYGSVLRLLACARASSRVRVSLSNSNTQHQTAFSLWPSPLFLCSRLRFCLLPTPPRLSHPPISTASRAFVALRCVAWRCVALRCVALRCVVVVCVCDRALVALRCVALRCVVLRCCGVCATVLLLRCVALRGVALRCRGVCASAPQAATVRWRIL